MKISWLDRVSPVGVAVAGVLFFAAQTNVHAGNKNKPTPTPKPAKPTPTPKPSSQGSNTSGGTLTIQASYSGAVANASVSITAAGSGLVRASSQAVVASEVASPTITSPEVAAAYYAAVNSLRDSGLPVTAEGILAYVNAHLPSTPLTISGGTLTLNTQTNGGLVKDGNGTLTLSGGGPVYGGTLTIDGGTLPMSGATLTLNGGTIYGGTVSGSTVTINGGTVYGGTLTINGRATGVVPPNGGLVLPGSNISLSAPTAVPEPSSALLVALGGCAALWRRRQRTL